MYTLYALIIIDNNIIDKIRNPRTVVGGGHRVSRTDRIITKIYYTMEHKKIMTDCKVPI